MNDHCQQRIRFIHLIGCAGAGTMPLARIFLEFGYICSGSDLLSNPATDSLQKAGLIFHQGHSAENLGPELCSENSLVVYTSAAAAENPELIEARKRCIPCLRRGDALAWIGERFPRSIAVCGSHGKTSVTSLCAFVLKELGYAPGFLIGGSVCGWPVSGSAGAKKILVTEVDESDSTNALFHSEIAVVTNIEDDHVWSVGGVEKLNRSFRIFAENAKHLLYVSSENTEKIFDGLVSKTAIYNNTPLRDWPFPSNWGRFQKVNAVTAFHAIKMLLPDVPERKLVEALMRFPGVERRMSVRFDNGFYRVIEDYAHHPTELKASLEALRETNPGRRLVVVFQPHRYARLKRYLAEFAEVLQQADRVLITPVFAAWMPDSDVNSGTLALRIGEKASAVSGSWMEIAEKVLREIRKNDLVAVIGAGDIREILPYLSAVRDFSEI